MTVEPEEVGLLLLVYKYPVLIFGHDMKLLEAMNGLIKVGSDGVQFAAEDQ